jgi:P4 family phage/plasmid primase-like protien
VADNASLAPTATQLRKFTQSCQNLWSKVNHNFSMDEDRLEALGGYQDLGLACFSLKIHIEAGKKRCIFPSNWQKLTVDSCPSAWAAHQNAIGIVTGKASNITVVDIDSARAEETVMKLASSNGGLGRCWTVRTFKGLHLYYRYTDSIKTSTNKKLEVDIRNDGGCVFAPPTEIVCPETKMLHVYSWDTNWIETPRSELDPVPGWLCDYVTPRAASSSDELKEAAELVGRLPGVFAEDYQQWVSVGMCLKNISDTDEALMIWDDFSKRGSSYVAGGAEVRRKWSSFASEQVRGFNIEWLRSEVRRCSEVKTPSSSADAITNFVVANEYNDHAIAQLFRDLYGDDYRYFNETWYSWSDGSGWDRSKQGKRHAVFNRLATLHDDLKARITELKAADDRKFPLGQCNRLKMNTGRNAIVSCLESMMDMKDDMFDKNSDLLGFTNGVIDLRTNEFRPHRREDAVTQKVSYDFKEMDVNGPECEEIQSWLTSLFRVDEERQFVLKALSSALRGMTLENLIVFTGATSNGKDTLKDMLVSALGAYAYETGAEVLTQDSKRSGPDPMVAGMSEKRLVVFNEASSKLTLCHSVVKKLTGGQHTTARMCHSNETNVHLVATMCMFLNGKPPLEGDDPAMARRMIVVPCRTTFVVVLDPVRHVDVPGKKYFALADAKYKTVEFRERNRVAFVNVLLNAFKRFREDGFIIQPNIKYMPQTFIDESSSYMEQSDQLYQWWTSEFTTDKWTPGRKTVPDDKYLYPLSANDDMKDKKLIHDIDFGVQAVHMREAWLRFRKSEYYATQTRFQKGRDQTMALFKERVIGNRSIYRDGIYKEKTYAKSTVTRMTIYHEKCISGWRIKSWAEKNIDDDEDELNLVLTDNQLPITPFTRPVQPGDVHVSDTARNVRPRLM